VEGWRRVLGAPAVTIGVIASLAFVAVPQWLIGRDARLLDVAPGAHAEGVARTLLALGGLDAAAAPAPAPDPASLSATVFAAALGLFLWGGILDRLARQRPTRTAAFFAACGVHFFRFVRLGAIAGAAYWAIFGWLYPLLSGGSYDWWTRAFTPGAAPPMSAVSGGVMIAAIALAGLVADFAAVRAVVEDRRSMIGAVLASLRFVRRRVARVAGLYLLNVIALALVAAVWAVAAPSAAASASWTLLAGQIVLLARVWTRLVLAASEIVFFQSELAHAAYAAAPPRVWPESPTVEGLRNLRPDGGTEAGR
jgi:hypothetical protein